MDILNTLSLSGGGLTAFVLFGALGAALMVFVAGAALALRANRAADESRIALADAEAKLNAAAGLVDEVRSLKADVDRAMAMQSEALAAARHQHNESCGAHYAAPVEPAPAPAFEPREDMTGDAHDDDRHYKKKHALRDEHDGDVRQGFFGWLFDR
jgi:hypothetical protein